MKEKLIKYFSKQKKVKMAFLYGSYATNTPLFDSDVDVAVYMEDGFSKKDIDSIWNELIFLTKKDVELLVLNDAKEAISWSAIRGIPLVIKDQGFYTKYMLSVSFDAMNLNEDLEDIWRMKNARN